MASQHAKRAKYDIPSEPIRYNNEELRIVLVGKTGVGKSATANSILGKQIFDSKFSFNSLTVHCNKARGEVDGQQVAVIDTPGLFDTSTDEKETVKDVVQCISYAAPGPHVFLIVIRVGRFTKEEKQAVQKIQEMFGEESHKYSMVLFTHGDLLKGEPIEKSLAKSKELQDLVATCNGQYHVFENSLEDRSQVRELLNKMRNITEKNGGGHYTAEMFQKAEREIEERKQQILKEKEEQMRKEREELEKKIKEKYEQEMKQVRDDMEKERELSAARQRETEDEIKKLKEMQDQRAREEAESNNELLDLLVGVFKQVLPCLIRKLISVF